MILEVMAQAATFLFYTGKKNSRVNFFLGMIDKTKFMKPVVPGDQLKVVISVLRITPNDANVHIDAFVDDQKVAESNMIFVRRK
jgi:3-hydroxymyristoyl/3-hydroxydecanoyl-(acyl carrier protein) dehydratase